MEEIERTYLAKNLPSGILESPSKEVLDIYLPSSAVHPGLRIRKSGDKCDITKKRPLKEGDSSYQLETTVPLTPEEYLEISTLPGKRIRKIRYYYEQDRFNYEVDVFKDSLEGLVLVDIEFKTVEEKDSFAMPDFCLREVTQEAFIAGGMVCGKKYSDLEGDLERFGYKPLFLNSNS